MSELINKIKALESQRGEISAFSDWIYDTFGVSPYGKDMSPIIFARQKLEEFIKADEQERQFICRKCGLREELGTKTEPTF